MSNPASRLHTILTAAKQQSGNSTTYDVWVKVLELKPADAAGVFYGLAQLRDQLEWVKKSIRLLPVRHERYLRFCQSVEAVLSFRNLDTSWSTASAGLDAETLARLEFCDEEIGKDWPETDPDPETLQHLRDDVEELTKLIESADLPKQLQSLLLDLAESMRHALQQFRIRGVQGLREAFAIIRERVEQNAPALVTHLENPAVSRFQKIVAGWNVVTTACINTGKIITGTAAPLLKWFH